ncbi:MAG: hypothetical protein IKR85_03705 [Clostridia bacterium]|nr:hypothetical protein [Clostridia bacterium]
MYTEQDFIDAARQTKLRVALGIALICIFVILTVTFRIMDIEALVLISAGLGFALVCFVWSMKISPWVKYNRFLKEMRNGRSRTCECSFISFANETRFYDGVEIYDMNVTVGDREEDERLYLFDADKPLPALKAGEKLTVKSFGNFVKEIIQEDY